MKTPTGRIPKWGQGPGLRLNDHLEYEAQEFSSLPISLVSPVAPWETKE